MDEASQASHESNAKPHRVQFRDPYPRYIDDFDRLDFGHDTADRFCVDCVMHVPDHKADSSSSTPPNEFAKTPSTLHHLVSFGSRYRLTRDKPIVDSMTRSIQRKPNMTLCVTRGGRSSATEVWLKGFEPATSCTPFKCATVNCD